MRISSGGREQRPEIHNRRHSLDSHILYRKNNDDDLALFKEVQDKETKSFLLQSSDDIDDILYPKSKSFSIPIRRLSHNDLLNAEGDKNDYDWLTETPLFPSLDDDARQTNMERRGRPRSKPVSRSQSVETGYKYGSGNASPRRLSPSPQPGNRKMQPRSRSISATPPRMRPPSPSRTPPSRPSALPRSSTPPPRRLSTGSRIISRGTSPIKTSRPGNNNSVLPQQLNAWQNNIPGFSSEAPPNLRTSLSHDRSASRNSRRSMSPTASRASVDSHRRSVSSSKKPTKLLSSSAPKGSVDFALQEKVNCDGSVKGHHHPDLDDELIAMDQVDAMYEDFEREVLTASLDDWPSEIDDDPSFNTADRVLDSKDVHPDVVGSTRETTIICSKCNSEVNSPLLSSLDVDISRETEIPLGQVPRYPEDTVKAFAAVTDNDHKEEESISCDDISASHEKEGGSILLEDKGGEKARTLMTMDEATDTILFCSSIVHNLAYEAANIAIDKNETTNEKSDRVEVSPPTITYMEKTSCDGRDIRSRSTGKYSQQKANQDESMEMDMKPTSSTKNVEKFSSSSTNVDQDFSKVDNYVNPLKMDARCNCTIM